MSLDVSWAEAVANSECKFSDVPEDRRSEVRRLLDKLMDPQAVIPITNTDYRWDSVSNSLVRE